MTEERLKKIEEYRDQLKPHLMSRGVIDELLAALREAQARYNADRCPGCGRLIGRVFGDHTMPGGPPLCSQAHVSGMLLEEAEARAEKAEGSLVAAVAELGLQNAPCDAGEMAIASIRALFSSVRQAQASNAGEFARGVEAAAQICRDLSWNKFTGPETLRQQQRVALLEAQEKIRALLPVNAPAETKTDGTD